MDELFSENTIDYVIIPTAACVVAYAVAITGVLIAIGNGWLSRWK